MHRLHALNQVAEAQMPSRVLYERKARHRRATSRTTSPNQTSVDESIFLRCIVTSKAQQL
jgi:hypothetical protein